MESGLHIQLCNQLKQDISFLKKTYQIKRICASTAAACNFPSCPQMFGFIPDFFGYTRNLDFAFVGEAKTKNDILNIHTKDQINAYLRYLDPFKFKLLLFRVENEDLFRIKRLLLRSFGSKKGVFQVNAQAI